MLHADYIRIPNGNLYLALPYGENAAEKAAFAEAATNHALFGEVWRQAFSYLDPYERVDFSDTAELLYILGLSEINIYEFGKRYLDSNPFGPIPENLKIISPYP